MKIVAALGGNAIIRYREKGTAEEQLGHIDAAIAPLARMIAAGHQVLVTHGNGPQVGDILLQNECAKDAVPRMPLDICGAESQGMIGYMIQQCMQNRLESLGVGAPVAAVLTRTLVDGADPAFAVPSKAIGPYYTGAEAQSLGEAEGWTVREEAGRGWRRLVPSPAPSEILEAGAIRTFFESGAVVIAGGGGGVPVVREADGLRGVEAVVDKDLAAERLASAVGADHLLMLTDVGGAYLDFGGAEEEMILSMDAQDARLLLARGEFGAGTMAPKIEAAVRFVEGGGGTAVIAHLDAAEEALAGRAGTRVTPA
ncbi:carbamate kinase [Methanofollis aquaemaris]|uniref:Carbamate kinase n=1 Tax=Methanofollis aquaemaris TaxID=126734 RepID=A0A8A3S839_9EURY|nr:carbamate kinase [Methanofollis aquaemaris]QSZ68019.1 carbamate kinase [Methanofollis aquaemaris]